MLPPAFEDIPIPLGRAVSMAREAVLRFVQYSTVLVVVGPATLAAGEEHSGMLGLGGEALGFRLNFVLAAFPGASGMPTMHVGIDRVSSQTHTVGAV